MKKKVLSKKKTAVSKKKKPTMTDAAAGLIALELLYQKMGNEGGCLKHLKPENVSEAAKELGISYAEAVDFVEKFYNEVTRRIIATLKKG